MELMSLYLTEGDAYICMYSNISRHEIVMTTERDGRPIINSIFSNFEINCIYTLGLHNGNI